MNSIPFNDNDLPFNPPWTLVKTLPWMITLLVLVNIDFALTSLPGLRDGSWGSWSWMNRLGLPHQYFNLGTALISDRPRVVVSDLNAKQLSFITAMTIRHCNGTRSSHVTTGCNARQRLWTQEAVTSAFGKEMIEHCSTLSAMKTCSPVKEYSSRSESTK